MNDASAPRPRRLADAERDGTVFVYDLERTPTPPSLPGARPRAAIAADAAALQEAMESSGLYPPDVVTSRLAQGRRPYVVEADGLIAAYGWAALSPEPIGDLGIAFLLEPGEAWIYDCATRPAYRGRGYYTALLRCMVADLWEQTLRRAWIGTAPGNAISQRGIVRAGFTKVADTGITRGPDGRLHIAVYGVPGISRDLLEHAAWSFHGHAYPDTGIPAGV
ncbi:MAG TPA: GNAT family N-acetyltransferase [Chloroflexota bacterium]|nr:GNAT family N-acetyltransferase [Chloroflexota bacterium]